METLRDCGDSVARVVIGSSPQPNQLSNFDLALALIDDTRRQFETGESAREVSLACANLRVLRSALHTLCDGETGTVIAVALVRLNTLADQLDGGGA